MLKFGQLLADKWNSRPELFYSFVKQDRLVWSFQRVTTLAYGALVLIDLSQVVSRKSKKYTNRSNHGNIYIIADIEAIVILYGGFKFYHYDYSNEI